MHDAIETAVRARRKYFPDMPAPLVARAAQLGDAAPMIQVRKLARLSNIALPERRRPANSSAREEDPQLSAFLRRQVDAALSDSKRATPCPWCGSDQTTYHLVPRPSGLPGFRCRACLAYFTRVSNTPLVHPMARAYASRFVRMLGWHETGAGAARELGIAVGTLHTWVRSWRQWLLVLDPTATMEGRVMLTLRAQKPA